MDNGTSTGTSSPHTEPVRHKLLTDPDTTLDQLKPLRLVCKIFDSIYAPIVTSHIVFFPSHLPYPALITRLRSLVLEPQSATSLQSLHPPLTHCTTLTIKDWRFANTFIDRRSSRIPIYQNRRAALLALRRKFWNRGLTTDGFFLVVILGTVVFLAISVIHSVETAIYFSIVIIIFLFLWAFYHRKSIDMEKMCRSIKSIGYVPRARHYVARLPGRLAMPNIRCVRLFVDSRESDWSIHYSSRLILSFSQLTELELAVSPPIDLTYLTKCFAPLKNLRKLSLLHIGKIAMPDTASLGTLIAQIEHLTHFEYDWRSDAPYNLSLLFHDIQVLKPLRLFHVSLNGCCTNFKALVPHLQSLASFQFRWGKNDWCSAFLTARVFPTTIKVGRIDEELISFIREHPGIINLSISADMIPPRPEECPLFNVLCRHTESLRHLCLNTKLLSRMLFKVEFEMNFLLCTANLRELILLNGETMSYHPNSNSATATYAETEQRIFPVIARLDPSLMVVIASQYKMIFDSSLDLCRTSTNPLVRDLARRLLYEKPSS